MLGEESLWELGAGPSTNIWEYWCFFASIPFWLRQQILLQVKENYLDYFPPLKNQIIVLASWLAETSWQIDASKAEGLSRRTEASHLGLTGAASLITMLFSSSASANICNVVLMRHTELEEGIDVLDNNGNIVGSSRIAAKHVRTGDGPGERSGELVHDELYTRNPTAVGINDLKEIEINELYPSCRKNKAIKPRACAVPTCAVA